MLGIKNSSPTGLQAADKAPIANSNNLVDNVSNWYSDRYNSTVVQRNLLLIILIAAIALVIASTFVVGNIASSFKIQPFVIDIEETTGITNIVNPLSSPDLTANDALNKYFLMDYVKAREGYSINSWRYNYLTVVRLLSSPTVYNDFRRFINSSNSPIALYGNQISVSIVFRSIQLFPPVTDNKGVTGDSQAVIRFSIFPDNGATLQGATGNRIHKILTVTYRYDQTEMSNDDRAVNPLGFFITSYRTDIENDNVENSGF
jgi:type IV secretion system protein VirB8